MKEGPNIAGVAALVGDPARANILSALMDGRALTASELAREAGVTPQTASSHLAKLEAGGLLAPIKQGRHRYYRLSGADVADVLERLMGLAARTGHMRTRTGPKDSAMRTARVCYDHLAGDRAVWMLGVLQRRRFVREAGNELVVTKAGESFFDASLGIDVTALRGGRRPLCRSCLDWSERRTHLAGALGAAILDQLFDRRIVEREAGGRTIKFKRNGEAKFKRLIEG